MEMWQSTIQKKLRKLLLPESCGHGCHMQKGLFPGTYSLNDWLRENFDPHSAQIVLTLATRSTGTGHPRQDASTTSLFTDAKTALKHEMATATIKTFSSEGPLGRHAIHLVPFIIDTLTVSFLAHRKRVFIDVQMNL